MIVMRRRKKTVLGGQEEEETAVFDNQIEHKEHLADSASQIPL